jgi:hypothetical protein
MRSSYHKLLKHLAANMWCTEVEFQCRYSTVYFHWLEQGQQKNYESQRREVNIIIIIIIIILKEQKSLTSYSISMSVPNSSASSLHETCYQWNWRPNCTGSSTSHWATGGSSTEVSHTQMRTIGHTVQCKYTVKMICLVTQKLVATELPPT